MMDGGQANRYGHSNPTAPTIVDALARKERSTEPTGRVTGAEWAEGLKSEPRVLAFILADHCSLSQRVY